jgi:hypothetical protein
MKTKAYSLVMQTFEFGHVIALYQKSKDCFAVQYGMQLDKELKYSEACSKLGEAILHALACQSKLDNG